MDEPESLGEIEQTGLSMNGAPADLPPTELQVPNNSMNRFVYDSWFLIGNENPIGEIDPDIPEIRSLI